MKVFKIDRTDYIDYCEDISMIVVAQDTLHAERRARLSSTDFKKAPLKVTEVDLETEACILKENRGE